MDADAVIPGYEAAWITAISEIVGFAIVAGYTDVIWPYDTANALRKDPGAPFDSC
jgi:hypothetical protein